MAAMPTSRHEAACASGSIAILSAMRDIEAGHYAIACVLGLELMRNVDGKTGAEYLGAAMARQGGDRLRFSRPFLFDRITGNTTAATALTASISTASRESICQCQGQRPRPDRHLVSRGCVQLRR